MTKLSDILSKIEIQNISCKFISYRSKTKRFYFRGKDWRKSIKIDGYINLNDKINVWRYSEVTLKDFDGYRITDINTNKVLKEVNWNETS